MVATRSMVRAAGLTACLSAALAQVAAGQTVKVGEDGRSVVVDTANGPVRLETQPPEIRSLTRAVKTPGNYHGSFDRFEPWPPGTQERPGAVSISPPRDEQGTPILGALYRSIQPETVVLTSADGSRTFKPGEDYRYEPDWARVAAIDGRLGEVGTELKVTYAYATQRLDLIQVDAAGKPSIKSGKSVMVCPQLPAPDIGFTGIAGVYIAPWKRDGKYTLAQEDIYPIRPAKVVSPIRPEAVARSRQLLAEGKELRIAFLGDSVTLGAEAGAWWDGLWTEQNKAYVSRLVVDFRKRYPKATVTPIHAAVGATTTKQAPAMFDEKVAPQKPDLVLIAFGLNDAHGPTGGPPNHSVADYKEAIRQLTRRAKALNAEVILVSAMQASPFLKNGIGERMKDYRQALIELANEEQVGCADVYTAWMRQADAGIPPFSQLHNWNNHPGPDAHAIYSDTIRPFLAPDRP